MVYSEVFVIRGYPLTTEEFSSRLSPSELKEFDQHQEDYCGEEYIQAYLTLPEGLEVYRYPCCSELAGKTWLIGYISQRTERKDPETFDCPACNHERWDCCDRCLGLLEDGTVCDPRTILNQLTETLETGELDEVKEEALKLLEPEYKSYLMMDDCLSCT